MNTRSERATWRLAIAATTLIVFGSSGDAKAEEPKVRAHLELSAAHFVGGWQKNEIGTGGVATGAVELGISRRFGIEARFFGARFVSGDDPPDQSLRPAGASGFFGGGLGFRLRPFADLRGIWIGAAFDVMRTGGLTRTGFDARLGYDIRVSDHLVMGPMVGYAQIFQPDSGLRADDGHLLMLGLHFGFDEGDPPPPVAAKVFVPEPKKPEKIAQCADGSTPNAAGECPAPPKEEPPPVVVEQAKVVNDEIVLNDRVYFDFNLANVKPGSFSLLKSVATIILEHPEFVLVHVFGHTDEFGSDEWNQKLSEARAAAVVAKLVEFGVSADRLDAKGFGKTQPINLAKSPLAWMENRRVEFRIVREVKKP